jgi:glycosyltransferase involved in cell wall biosynthesis
MTYKIGILSTHPIQYYSPWYRELAARPGVDLTVYYAHRPSPEEQGAAGFGVPFEWDVPLLDGYRHVFLVNRSARPTTDCYGGCDTPEIADVIRREQFAGFVVQGWYTRSYCQAIRACWQTGTPVLVRGDSTLLMAGGWGRRLVKWLSHRPFVCRFDSYLVVGRRAREYYLAYGADPDRMEFCPHFVDNERFGLAAAQARLRRQELRHSWGLPESAVVFLFAAKFIPKKRPLDFVRAVARAARAMPVVAGLMVGDGPLAEEVEAAIRDTNAPVRRAGFLNQTEIPAAYAAADVLVLPSDGTETWGLVVNEAMACGLPALVSDHVGCGPDLVLDGETGYTFSCGDVQALVVYVQKLAADADLRTRQGAGARARVERYSVRVAADGLCRAVARVSARPRTTGAKLRERLGCRE